MTFLASTGSGPREDRTIRHELRGATVSWVGAVDPRAKCIVSVVGVGHGIRWMSRGKAGGRVVRPAPNTPSGTGSSGPSPVNRRWLTGTTYFFQTANRWSCPWPPAGNNPSAINSLPMEYVDETLGFNPEWIVDKDFPQAYPLHHHRRRPHRAPGGIRELFNRAGEPRSWYPEGLRPLRGLPGTGVGRSHGRNPGLVLHLHSCPVGVSRLRFATKGSIGQ